MPIRKHIGLRLLTDEMPLLAQMLGSRIDSIDRLVHHGGIEFLVEHYPTLAEPDYFSHTSGPVFLTLAGGVIVGFHESETDLSLAAWREDAPLTAAAAADKCALQNPGVIMHASDERYSNDRLWALAGQTISSVAILKVTSRPHPSWCRHERGILIRTAEGGEIVIGTRLHQSGPPGIAIMSLDHVRHELREHIDVIGVGPGARTERLAPARNVTAEAQLASDSEDTGKTDLSEGGTVPETPMPSDVLETQAVAASPEHGPKKLGPDRLVIDTAEWLPEYGASNVEFQATCTELSVFIFYDGEHELERREFRFKGMCEFSTSLFPGPNQNRFAITHHRTHSLQSLVEYPDSEAAAEWRRHYLDYQTVRHIRHFDIYFTAANRALTVFADEVELHSSN